MTVIKDIEQNEIDRICQKYQLVESSLFDLTGDIKDMGKTFISNCDPIQRNGNELTLYIRKYNGMWEAIGYVTRDITHITETFSVKHFTLEDVYKYSIDIYFQNY